MLVLWTWQHPSETGTSNRPERGSSGWPFGSIWAGGTIESLILYLKSGFSTTSSNALAHIQERPRDLWDIVGWSGNFTGQWKYDPVIPCGCFDLVTWGVLWQVMSQSEWRRGTYQSGPSFSQKNSQGHLLQEVFDLYLLQSPLKRPTSHAPSKPSKQAQPRLPPTNPHTVDPPGCAQAPTSSSVTSLLALSLQCRPFAEARSKSATRLASSIISTTLPALTPALCHPTCP